MPHTTLLSREMRAALIASAVAAVLWGLAVASIWARILPAHSASVVVSAAAASSVIAAVCWPRRPREEDEERRLLIRTIDGLTPPAETGAVLRQVK